ncbi:MAG: integrin alpha [Acidobacteriota bacterium]
MSHRFLRTLAMLGLAVFVSIQASEAQPFLTVDLAAVSPDDGELRRIYGSDGQGDFGLPVAGGFDVDGDGFGDYAVGFMTVDSFGRDLSGEVDLVFGDGTLQGTIDTAVADPRILRFAGAGERETAGSEIWMDDVTGDGLGDLLICRQNHTPGAGRAGAGALTIAVGGAALRTQAATLTTVDLLSPPASLTLTTIVGAEATDRFCIWARTGDVTGDGIADIVVGADQEDDFGESNRGAIYVIRGGAHLASGTTVDLQNFGATTLAGHLAKVTPPLGASGFHLGGTCQIADLDGNGRAEVLAAATINRAGATIDPAGAPGSAQATGGAPDGTLYIAWDDNFTGNPWPAGFNFDISASPGARTIINGETVHVSFGEEILGGLDYDDDGHADLFVGDLIVDGTPGGTRPVSGYGHVFFEARDLKSLEFDLETPPAGLTITRIYGPSDGALGADTAAHGDFDGDGLGDLAFASPHHSPLGRDFAGGVHVLFGKAGGWPAEIDLLDGAMPSPSVLRITEVQGAVGSFGPDTGDTLGYSAAAGDVDGDGLTDLVINEMVGNGAAPFAVDVGNLILISGRALSSVLFLDGFESGDFSAWSSIATR